MKPSGATDVQEKSATLNFIPAAWANDSSQVLRKIEWFQSTEPGFQRSWPALSLELYNLKHDVHLTNTRQYLLTLIIVFFSYALFEVSFNIFLSRFRSELWPKDQPWYTLGHTVNVL
ncbi:hypothetical protein CPC08DRAFT_68753 [Agrocybe pediades]|nr:hypothetical protein CPC08DRAFT_68753 [Agrocybe pediades]